MWDWWWVCIGGTPVGVVGGSVWEGHLLEWWVGCYGRDTNVVVVGVSLWEGKGGTGVWEWWVGW